MRKVLARTLMDDFAASTGIEGNSPPRRYLWTDAFAVCNFLGLARQTGDDRYLRLARKLVDQVHHVLGRHRDDDSRRGWISGLSQDEGEKHPTSGGLRIGKSLNERKPDQPLDQQLEWDRDGQYFHYLTKWMHALNRMWRETGESRFQQWAAELATAAHDGFTGELSPGGPMQIAWKMSIDLSRPLISSQGQHDPLDGLITCLELQTSAELPVQEKAALASAVADMTEMCANGDWATDDPLGIGGLLDDATRLAQLVFEQGSEHRELLFRLLVAAESSLRGFSRSALHRSAEHRLAFRELGLSIGLHGLQRITRLASRDRLLAVANDQLQLFQPLAEQIENFWADPAHRGSRTWTEHRDINTVMLATSLAPNGYLQL